MKSLVFLEHYHGALEKGGLGVLGKAASLGDAPGVVLGEGAAAVAASAGAFGAAKVYACEAPSWLAAAAAARRRARDARRAGEPGRRALRARRCCRPTLRPASRLDSMQGSTGTSPICP